MIVKKIIMGAFMGVMALTALFGGKAVTAANCPPGSANPGASTLAGCSIPAEESNTDLMGTLQVVVNVILSVLGIVAVIVIIIGGFTYMTSAGDASKAAKARNTILYGVIGLIIALLAFAIVNFVLNGVFK